MGPPTYANLGSDSRNIFDEGYYLGMLKLDVKTKTGAGIEFSTCVPLVPSSQQDPNNEFGVETKYKIKEHGVTFSEKWNTDNTLSAEAQLVDNLIKGLKTSADCSFALHTGNKTCGVKTEFTNECIAVNCDLDVSVTGPAIKTSAVIGFQNWLAGYQTVFDARKVKVTANNFALGYATKDFTVHTSVNDGQEFAGSIYQKIDRRLVTAISMAWSPRSNNTLFGIGCKYILDRDTSIRAKVNNQSQIGLGYRQKLRDGVRLGLSVLIDGKNFNSGEHQFGAALELEA